MTIDPDLLKGVVALAAGILFCYIPSKWIVPCILCTVDDPEKIPSPSGVDDTLWQNAVSVPNEGAAGHHEGVRWRERIEIQASAIASTVKITSGCIFCKVTVGQRKRTVFMVNAAAAAL